MIGLIHLERLYGKQGAHRLRISHVAVIGLGGVGSWVAEALARSGVGALTLVDLDDVCESNINRQVHALHSTVGRPKAQVLAQRLLDINPDIKLDIRLEFFSEGTAEALFAQRFDYVVDAIDSLKNKCLLVDTCRARGIRVITIGAAGGKTDPSLIRVTDLSRSREDMLLMRMRKKLRTKFEWPKGKKAHFGVWCVYSEERAVYPTLDGGTCLQKQPDMDGKLDCESGLGSACYITGTFAFFAAAHVARELANNVD